MFAALCGVASGMTGYLIGGAFFHATWKFIFKKKAAALQEVSNQNKANTKLVNLTKKTICLPFLTCAERERFPRANSEVSFF